MAGALGTSGPPKLRTRLPSLLPMTPTNGSGQELAASERRALQRQLFAHREQILDDWMARQFDPSLVARWQIAGLEGVETAVLRRGYLEPLFNLLTQHIGSGQPRWRAVYRDERLRYAPHQATPLERAQFFAEVIPIDEDALLAAVDPVLRARLKDELTAIHGTLLTRQKPDVSVLAVGDCLMNELRVFLPDAARARGFETDVRCVYFSAVTGRDISSAQLRDLLSKNKIDVLAFSFFSYAGVPAYSSLLREADSLSAKEIETRAAAVVGIMRRFLEELRSLTDAPFAVHNASGLPLTQLRRRLPFVNPLSPGRRHVVDAVNASIKELAEHSANTHLIDEREVAQRHGYRDSMEPVVPHSRDALFHTARFGEFLSVEYADLLASYECLRKAKVLAVDFDNTLWNGVMADGPVAHHHDRQSMLKAAKDAGMLLVAVSKNDPANIRWHEMRLAPEDFVLQKISWDLKVESIAAAAKQLSLGLDSFVLLDDNSAERELVASQLPAVRTLDADDPFSWRSVVRLLRFPNTKATEEARTRTEMYRQAAQRQEALQKSFDYGAMMAGLDLRLDFWRATKRDLDRVVELVQRTNQFNTTTRRYSRQQLQQFMERSDYAVYVASLADKFGALGVVLTVIVRREDGEATIDSFVMSCRAMGFQLEQAVMRLVLETEAETTRWRGEFIPTDRNTPCASLFSDCGFARQDSIWVLDAAAPRPEIPAWFTLRRELAPIAR